MARAQERRERREREEMPTAPEIGTEPTERIAAPEIDVDAIAASVTGVLEAFTRKHGHTNFTPGEHEELRALVAEAIRPQVTAH